MTRAWEKLTDSGVQQEIYADNPRKDVYSVFVHEPMRVLDIGCAAGAVSGAIKADLPHVFAWGCELNPHAAQAAATRLDKVTDKPIDEWGEEEFELLKTIDTVLLLDVLEHMYNPWQSMQILSQHLPSYAQIIISLPNIVNVNTMHDMSQGYWHYKPLGVLDVTHIRFFSLYEMEKMFYETGYKVQVQSYPYLLGSIEAGGQAFPFWFQTDSFSVLVRDERHWQSLNAQQIYFRLSVAADSELNEHELNLRHGEHTQTLT